MNIEIVEERIRQYSPDRVAVQLAGYLNKMKGAKDNPAFYKEINADQSDPLLGNGSGKSTLLRLMSGLSLRVKARNNG